MHQSGMTEKLGETVVELALCETAKLFLHPNVLYRFYVMENCEVCKRLTEIASR